MDELPGISRVPESKKGEKTKADTLRDLITRAGPVQLFRAHNDVRSFLKLRVDYKKMKECMVENGGADAFGTWGDGDPSSFFGMSYIAISGRIARLGSLGRNRPGWSRSYK